MTRQPTRERAGVAVELKPIGAGGWDPSTDPVALAPDRMRFARNVDASRGVYARKLGPAKIAQIEDDRDDRGAKQFATAAKYATFAPPLMLAGSWALPFHFTAVRHATNDGYLLDSQQDATPHRIIRMRLTAAGVLIVGVTWTTNVEDVITTSALTANSTQHGLLVFNGAAGTLTLYLNGEVAGTPIAGLSATKQLYQSVALSWHLGVASSSVPVRTLPFQGYLDDFAFLALPGVDLTDEDLTLDIPRKSLLTSLRERTFQGWPTPQDPAVVFHYTLDDDTTLTSVMLDSSNAARHGTYVGTPANAPRVAVRSMNGQFLGTTRNASVGLLDDGRVNVLIAGGQTMVEHLRVGS